MYVVLSSKLLFFIVDKGHFKKENFNTYGTNYDYDSIMHSGPYAYGKGKQTLKAKNQRYRNSIGKQVYLSETDKTEINKMYHCRKSFLFSFIYKKQLK